MQKLSISRNKNGKYYTKIINRYSNCFKYVTVTLPKNTELNADFGIYDCEYYLSCFQSNGGVDVIIIVTKIWQNDYKPNNPDVNPYQEYKESDLPF